MQPQGESIWGNINLCIEIALDIYFMIGENGEGIVVPKERAEEVFSEKTVEAGKEADGCLYYPKGDTMEMPLYEMMQKRAALARKMEIAAAKQMEQIRGMVQAQRTAFLQRLHRQQRQSMLSVVRGMAFI